MVASSIGEMFIFVWDSRALFVVISKETLRYTWQHSQKRTKILYITDPNRENKVRSSFELVAMEEISTRKPFLLHVAGSLQRQTIVNHWNTYPIH